MLDSGHITLNVGELPETALAAHRVFMKHHESKVMAMLVMPNTHSLTLVMPPADHTHDDWRKAIARGLAREFAPARVNVAAGNAGEALDLLLNYLSGASGVTGQYCQVHE